MDFIFSPLIGIVINGVSLFALTFFVKEIHYTGGIKFFILGGAVMGAINFILRPLLKIVSAPFMILTGGLFLIVINMALLWFLSYFLKVAAFQDVSLAFPNLGSYVISAVIFGIVNWITNLILK
ncbi:phage holin family protein [Candidatus Peregrinibacteria bacterium]|nr:phage holin family protein [Candidatus Peregrinibacteria bacterium]